MSPLLMMFAVLTLALAAAVAAYGLMRGARQRERHQAVVASAIAIHRQEAPHPQAAQDTPRNLKERWLAWMESIGASFHGSTIERRLLTAEDRLLLDQCGVNSVRGRTVFLATRIVLALALPIVVAAWQSAHGSLAVIEWLAAFGAGLLLPKFALSQWAERARRRAADELPLLLDLLRLLQSVGMSMDQSLHIIAEQFRNVIPVLGRELKMANDAYARGRDREHSLRRLAEIFQNEELRALVGLVIQVDRHGGAVQEPLKQFSTRLREQRRMRMKEAVGKLSVKMTVVMMLTLLPALMLVLAGPAIIALIGAVSKLGGG